MKDSELNDLFESGENVEDIFESGEDVNTLQKSDESAESLFASGEDVESKKSTKKSSTSVAGPILGSVVGSAAGGLTGYSMDLAKDMALTHPSDLISKIPGGILKRDSIDFIRQNPAEYRQLNSSTRSAVADSLAEAAEGIKNKSFESAGEAKDIMNKQGISVSSDKLKEILAEPLMEYSSELKAPEIDAHASPYFSNGIPLEKSGSVSQQILEPSIDPITGKDIVEKVDSSGIEAPTLKEPSTKNITKSVATASDLAKHEKKLAEITSNVHKSILEIAPELKTRNLSDQGLVNFLKNVTENDLNKIVGDKGARVYERVQNWREMIDTEAAGGTDKQKYIGDVEKLLRDEVTRQSPEADIALKKSHNYLNDYDFIKKQANLGEITEDLDTVIDSFPTESTAIKALSDPKYMKKTVAKEGTDKLISSMGKKGLEFRRRLDSITGVLKKHGHGELAKQVEMQVIKEAIENGNIPSKAYIRRMLTSALGAVVGGATMGPTGAVLGGAAGSALELSGTKIQGKLASGIIPNKISKLLEDFQGTKLAKSLTKGSRPLTKLGTILGGIGAASTAVNAGEALGKTVFEGDLGAIPKFVGSELGGDLALGLGNALAKSHYQGNLDDSIPEEDKDFLENSVFRDDYVNPISAISKGQSEDELSDWQKQKLEKYKSYGITPEKIQNGEVQLPGGKANESLFKNIVKAKEKKLKDFKLKNKITDLSNDDLDQLSQRFSTADSTGAQMFRDQLDEVKSLEGRARTSQLFNLMQQPAFRSLLKKSDK